MNGDSIYAHLTQIRLFFDFIAASYGDEDGAAIAGPSFRNPIIEMLDLPRTRGSRSRGTNKKPFAKFVLPHLLHWLYCVEQFGIFLREKDLSTLKNERMISTESYGFEPTYTHLGKVYTVTQIPRSLLSPLRGESKPWLTVIRMILVAMETGLRFQSVQWLCRMTYDRLNTGTEGQDFYRIYRKYRQGERWLFDTRSSSGSCANKARGDGSGGSGN